MKEKVQTVIMSHLSDAQLCSGVGMSQEGVRRNINFVKFLIQRYPNTLDTIDPDKEYEDFKKKHPTL